MDLVLTEDELAIEYLGRDVMSRHFGVEVAPREAAGIDWQRHPGWASLIECGWFGVSIDEAYGGAGLRPTADSVLYREAGKVIAPVCTLATTIAAHAAVAASRYDVLEPLLTGGMRAAFGIAGIAPSLVVLDPPAMGLVVLVQPQSCSVHTIDESTLGASVELIDPTTPARSVSLIEDPVLVLDGTAAARIDQLLRLFAASMLVGIAQRSLAAAVSWSKEREAFGHLIGTYQAIKHRCADVAIHTEAADAQTMFAATALAEARPESGIDIDAAYVLSLKAALAATGTNVQVHGAMGITWEHWAHLFVSRTRVLEHIAGGTRPALHRLLEHRPAMS